VKLVIFGLTISSAWGNGHATLWRGLCRALGARRHDVTFYERDVSYYAAHRDQADPAGCRLRLFTDFDEVRHEAEAALADADVAMVTSYCPDAAAASTLILQSAARLRVFYDLDTPITLSRLSQGEEVSYLPPQGLGDFDLALSYTGGRALTELRTMLGARQVAPLYGSVDPEAHHRVPAIETLRADLSYLGTYAADRQAQLERLFIEPARRRPDRKFVIGGSQYPLDFPWTGNIFYVSHMPPPDHPAFYSSSALTLNVTRAAMADMGYCPSGRLFEAAACGAPLLSDWWEGLDTFFEPGREILIARSTNEALDALDRAPQELARIGSAAHERVLAEHTATARVAELEGIFEAAAAAELC
jgi:spore maturation protein CgeB